MELSVQQLENLMTRIGVDEFDSTNKTVDPSGDFLEVIDPATNFGKVRRKILENVVVSKYIANQGINFVELYYPLWVDGFKAEVAIYFTIGPAKSGLKVKMVTKSLIAQVNGTTKRFLGFEAYNNYVSLLKKD